MSDPFKCSLGGGEDTPSRSGCGCGVLAFLIGGMILIDVIAMLLGLLQPSLQAAREAARRINCRDNLKMLGVAMLAYRDMQGSFPPAFVVGKDGKPMHSWRALLLPFVDSRTKSLGAKYHYDEPWDSPNNRQVTDVALQCFQCPTQPAGLAPTTHYMMVVGPHTISDGPHGRKQAEIKDDPATTIMLVEVVNSDVRWAEPKDLRFDQLDFTINGKKNHAIASDHPGGAHVLFCDGHVEFLNNNTFADRIKAMLTVDGSEKLMPSPK
jgi:prepilin-type processing-associated H-X9-DG protein